MNTKNKMQGLGKEKKKKGPGQMIVSWNKVVAVLRKKMLHQIFSSFSFLHLFKKLIFRNIWYNVHKITY